MSRLLSLLFVCSLATVALAQSADVSVSLTMDPTAVYTQGAYATSANGKVTVTNSGTVPAQNVTLDFGKAVGIDYYKYLGHGFTCNKTDHWQCTAASMAPGTFSESLGADWCCPLPAGTVETTTVTVSSTSPADPNLSNNSASANTTITWSSNLQLEYVDSYTGIYPGSGVWMGVHAVNYGPSPAPDFKMTFTIPPGATFEHLDYDLGWAPTCTTPAFGQSGTVVCTLSQWQPDEGHATIWVVVDIDKSTPPGTLTCNATISSSNTLKSPQSASGTIQVIPSLPPADLTVSMTSPASVNPGATYDNVVTVTNQGPSAAASPLVTFTILHATSLSTITGFHAPDGWNCTQGAYYVVRCSIASFPVGTATFTFPITLSPTMLSGTFTQSVTATTNSETHYADNTATTTTSISSATLSTLSVSATGPLTVNRGQTATYTYVLTNTSANDATGVVFQPYTLPVANPIAWSCPDPLPTAVQPSACHIGTLAKGASTTITATFPMVGTQDSSMEVVGYATASNSLSGGSQSLLVAVGSTLPTDLGVTISASPAAIHAGEDETYTVQVKNSGNAVAFDVAIALQLPGSPFTIGCGSQPPGTGCVSFSTLNAGATLNITVVRHFYDGVPGPLPASVTVTASNVTGSRTASTTTALVAWSADLVAGVTAPTSVRDGATATWTYSVTNQGPDNVDWHLTSTLPANTTIVSWKFVTGTGVCSLPTDCSWSSLAPGARVDLQFTLAVKPGTAGPLHAKASVSTSLVDPNLQNNTATADTAVIPTAELSAAITSDKTTAVVGERVTQTFVVTNFGPDAATGVAFDITLPQGAVFDSMSSTFASCTGSAPIHCLSPALAAGGTLAATVSFHAPAIQNQYESKASATWDNPGTSAGQVTGQAQLKVVPPPPNSDVSIAVDAAPYALNAGDAVTYTLGATNVGGGAASNVTVQLTLPPSLTLLSSSSQCTGNSVVTCTVGTLGAGKSAAFTVTARAVEAGSFTATATVSTTSVDANTDNNSDSATIVVNAAPTPVRRRAAHH